MKRLNDGLTYANVVATLALFIALTTGGAYAASQLARNSVGSKQLRKGAVGSRALKDSGVATRDLSRRVRTRLASTEQVNVAGDGTVRSGSASNVSRADPNSYTIAFKRSVAGCSYGVTLARRSTDDPASGTATISGSGGRELTVTTFDSAGTPVPAGFDLIVVC